MTKRNVPIRAKANFEQNEAKKVPSCSTRRFALNRADAAAEKDIADTLGLLTALVLRTMLSSYKAEAIEADEPFAWLASNIDDDGALHQRLFFAGVGAGILGDEGLAEKVINEKL